MRNRKTQSALLLAGAAAGVAAAWLGRRRLTLVTSDSEPLVEPPSAELPIGKSADRGIDGTLSRKFVPQPETTGSTLLGDIGPDSAPVEAEMEEVWSTAPELAEPEQTEGYDAVSPEDLGTVWLERATQTTHEPHPSVFESGIPTETENALISEASIHSAQAIDDDEALERALDESNDSEEIEDDPIDDDELGSIESEKGA